MYGINKDQNKHPCYVLMEVDRQETNERKGLCLTIRWGNRRAGKSTGQGRNRKHGLQGAPASCSAGRAACSHRQGGMWGCFCLCGSHSSCRPCTHHADSRPRTALPAHSHKVPCPSLPQAAALWIRGHWWRLRIFSVDLFPQSGVGDKVPWTNVTWF